MSLKKGNVQAKPTICWNCRNACPDRDGERGCNWSRSFTPVDGWTATQTIVKYQWGNDEVTSDTSYIVHECPEFVKG